MIVTGVIVLLVAGFGGPTGGNPLGPVQTRNVHSSKTLAFGCKLYAADHEGHFPLHLSELEPEYIGKGGVAKLRCSSVGRDDASKFQMDWLYFGAGFDDKNPPRLLIASPRADTSGTVKMARVMVQGDMAPRVAKEDNYQQLLGETVKQIRALQRARKAGPSTPAPDSQTPH